MAVVVNNVVVKMQPDSIDWIEPSLLGTSGSGLPVRAPYYGCVLGFSRTTIVQFGEWYRHLGQRVDMYLPHPEHGRMTEFTNVVVESIEERMNITNNAIASSGVDITLRRVAVT